MTFTRLKAVSPFFAFLGSLVSIFLLFSAAGTFLASSLLPQPPPFLKIKALVLLFLGLAVAGGSMISSRERKASVLGSRVEIKGLSFWLIGIFFFLSALGLSAPIIFSYPTGGDEGMWMNVIRNWILYSHYALGQPGSFQDFSPVMSVGPTVLVPLIALSRLFPESLWIWRSYALGWFTLTVMALYLLYSRMVDRHRMLPALFLALLFFHHSEIRATYSTVMGEMPALFFFILGILFFPLQPWLAGLFFGLAIVTKLTLFLILVLPFIFALSAWTQREKVDFKTMWSCILGALLPLVAWSVVRASFTNIPAEDNLQTIAEFLVFGIRDAGKRILRYGPMNFSKLILLWGGATFFIHKNFGEKKPRESQNFFIYAFSTFFILWFFFFTDGHFIRYTTYPIFLLIPLAVNALPETQALFKGSKPVLFFLVLIFLFQQELINIAGIPALVSGQKLPWISEQLKSQLKTSQPTIWTLDQFDGYPLSILTHPPVFWIREEMFFESDRGSKSYLSSNPMNVKVPQKENGFVLHSIRVGDLIAVGVPQIETEERKLYLLKIVHTPEVKTNRFVLSKKLPEELKTTLIRRLEGLGLEWREERAGLQENVYQLELWEASPDSPQS